MRVSSIFPNAAGTYSVFISGGYLRGKYTEHNALLECLRKECISLRSFGDYHFTVASLEDLLKVLKIFDEEGIDTEHIKSCINRNLLGLKDFCGRKSPDENDRKIINKAIKDTIKNMYFYVILLTHKCKKVGK